MGPEIRIHPAPNELPNKHGLGLLMSEARPRLKTIRSEPLLFSIVASRKSRSKKSLQSALAQIKFAETLAMHTARNIFVLFLHLNRGS